MAVPWLGCRCLRTQLLTCTSSIPAIMQTCTFISPLPLLQSPRLASTLHKRRATTGVVPVKAVLRPNIAVVGGGHAGLSTALRLSSLPWTRLTRPTITLIDRSDRFVFLPMLYELALSQVNQWEVAPKFADLLRDTDIRFVHGDVSHLHLADGVVEGTSRRASRSTGGDDFSVLFDRAVVAVGAEAARVTAVPGARDLALPFYSMEHAIALKQRLGALLAVKPAGAVINVIVVGGGFSGVELASCLAEHLGSAGSVLVVETGDQVLRAASDFNRHTSLNALRGSGAVVEYNARVVDISDSFVRISKNASADRGGSGGEDASTERQYPADLVLWTAGSRASGRLADWQLPLDDAGRVQTDEWLQVRGHEQRLYAVGDNSASASDDGFSGTAQVAMQQAEYAAWNIWASLTGRRPLHYRYTHLGEMMVLGACNASVTTSVGVTLDGRAAWVARRLAYLARMPTDRQRRLVAASWASHPLLDGLGNLVKASRQYRTST